MISKTNDEILEAAAEIIAGGHTSTGQMMLAGAMLETAKYHLSSGGGSHQAWVECLDALGDTCKILAKRERRKFAGL